jgi:hypothetical protein
MSFTLQTVQHSNKKPLALYVGEGPQKKGGSIKGTTLLKGYRHWANPWQNHWASVV